MSKPTPVCIISGIEKTKENRIVTQTESWVVGVRYTPKMQVMVALSRQVAYRKMKILCGKWCMNVWKTNVIW